MGAQGINSKTVHHIFQREQNRFHQDRPQSARLLNKAKQHMPNGVPCAWMDGLYAHQPIFVQHGEGAHFWDMDGHKYLDMNQADQSMNCGYGPQSLVAAVQKRVAEGSQFLLPVEESIEVSSLLAQRYQLPFWQYTLAASSANTEAIRIARAYTQKEYVLVFAGKYHGHIDDTMGEGPEESSLGFHQDFQKKTIIVDFNDVQAVELALKQYPVACIISEPALTNIGVVHPEDSFFQELRRLCDQFESLLIIDETHSQICAWGGLSRVWNIQADLLTLGKTVAAGIPMGCYGMTDEIAHFVAQHLEADDPNDSRGSNGGLAIGGTLFGNALSLAAAKVALTDILTPEAFQKSQQLGAQLSQGLQALFDRHQLPWLAQSLFARSGYTFGPQAPTKASEVSRYHDTKLYNAMRAFYANRGVWESISSAGPVASFVMEEKHITFYLNVVDEFLSELTA